MQSLLLNYMKYNLRTLYGSLTTYPVVISKYYEKVKSKVRSNTALLEDLLKRLDFHSTAITRITWKLLHLSNF